MKIKTNKEAVTKGFLSAGSSFALLKALQNSADPYTRVAIGSIAGFGILVTASEEYKLLGIGVMAGSLIQAFEVLEGARLTRNEYAEPLYAIKEDKGILEIPAGQVPDYPIEGFTYKGLNGVYKLANGVHGHINQAGKIHVPGIGALVNRINNGGLHDKSWCEQTGDDRWMELFQRSV